MEYKLVLAPRAQRDADQYFDYILDRSNDSVAAELWLSGLLEAMRTLQSFPARCARIPEQDEFDEPVHQLLYHSHRIIFIIEAERVNILRVYHSALKPLRALGGHVPRKRPNKP